MARKKKTPDINVILDSLADDDTEVTKAQLAVILRALVSSKTTLPEKLPDEYPPNPKVKGEKKHRGKKADLRCLIDAELLRLVQNEADSRFGGNVSRTMDWILWHFFRKPPLSFDVSDTQRETDRATNQTST